MDFGTIKRKLNAFEYNSYGECLSHIKLVFDNSDQYNLVSITDFKSVLKKPVNLTLVNSIVVLACEVLKEMGV